MERKRFLKNILAAATLKSMDGFSTIANAISYHNKDTHSDEFATFGAIHLNNTNIQKASIFWTKIVGMKQRKTSAKLAEFGTESQTLVVVHQTAKTAYKKGFSGLYHFAIHAPNKAAFASMIHRLEINNYPYSPVDHTMSKSIYLDDPDGINIEFTLETPERFKRVIARGGLRIEDVDGVVRAPSVWLDVNEVLKDFVDKNVSEIISNGTYLGHLHLYANNIQNSNAFYKQIGFLQFNFFTEYMYADLGAGGHYQHRIAMNSWHGINKPLAPKESAGLRHFQINYKRQGKLSEVLKKVSSYEESEGGYWLYDPTGNKIFLSNEL